MTRRQNIMARLAGVSLMSLGTLVSGICSADLRKSAVLAAAAPNGPQIVNLGVLLPDRGTVDRRLTIRNPSPRPITVTRIVTSCGCTLAKISNRLIAGNGEAALALHVAIRPWAGPERVSVLLEGARGGAPWRKLLLIKYRVRRMLRVFVGGKGPMGSQGYLRMGRVGVAARRLPKMTLVRGGYPAQWNRVKCRILSGILSAKLARTSRGRWALSLARTKPLYLGSQSCVLRLSFFDRGKELPYHLLDPITFNTAGPVDMVPGSLFFGVVGPGQLPAQQAQLWVGTPCKKCVYRITAVSPTGPANATARIVDRGQAVRLTLHTAGLAGRVEGHVVVVVSGSGKTYRFREDYLGYVLHRTAQPTAR